MQSKPPHRLQILWNKVSNPESGSQALWCSLPWILSCPELCWDLKPGVSLQLEGAIRRMCKKHLQSYQSSDRVLSVALKGHTQRGLHKSSEVAIEPNLTTDMWISYDWTIYLKRNYCKLKQHFFRVGLSQTIDTSTYFHFMKIKNDITFRNRWWWHQSDKFLDKPNFT